MVGHAAGSIGHVGHDVKGIVVRRLQVIDDVARRVVANDNLVFLIVCPWFERRGRPFNRETKSISVSVTAMILQPLSRTVQANLYLENWIGSVSMEDGAHRKTVL